MKELLLKLCRTLGLFHIAHRLTLEQPRILCYHGVALEDEHAFSPGLFMRPETFAARMALLANWGFRPVTLDDLYLQQSTGRYSPRTLVITIDDGWAGVYSGMLPTLEDLGFPATLYLSTYFVEKRRPVFKVAVYYLFWKHAKTYPVTSDSYLCSHTRLSAVDAPEVIRIAAALGSQAEQPILEELCDHFGESLEHWQHTGKFMFLSPDQVGELSRKGLDIELHTHRHRFSELDMAAAQSEIESNRKAITDMTGQIPTHFCFPRGEYAPPHLDVLRRLAMRTATTTHNELVTLDDSALELPRIMDSEHITALEFEAEISGFMSLLRRGQAWLPGER